MKKLWVKILVASLVIWTISAVYWHIGNTGQVTPIRFKDNPSTFQLVMDDLNIGPGPKIRAKSAIVVDLGTGKVLMKKDESSVRPIASLTKLTTALVFLGTKPNLFSIVTVTKEDRDGAGHSRLYVGEKLTLYDLMHVMLICSDNVAARIVARSAGMTQEEFVAKMNEYAGAMKLTNTHFADPTGLDSTNVSTAAEYALVFKAALDDDIISDIVSMKNHSFIPINGKRNFTVYNTNRLLYGKANIIGGKTGYTCQSGYCLAIGIESAGKKLEAIVLGAPSSGSRFRDAAKLLTSLGGT
jgi:D-alanyl-D-alanine endopeptidase (penicillin-binding protein 7)